MDVSLAWMADCKICALRFALMPREHHEGKSTDALTPHQPVGRFECPHCHEFADYATDDLIPSEGRIFASRAEE
ncbi:MAG: hypothetical protein P4M01_00815 [Acidobacteriota bacterium]|nr:hypothetical protein [Acidobacteriota bacterium]